MAVVELHVNVNGNVNVNKWPLGRFFDINNRLLGKTGGGTAPKL